jgi:LacI family transcriptional regulator
MKQVAERAGVSTSTVSHVINQTRAVSADVRARVHAIIAERRYVPSAVARSLKSDRTRTLGLMVPDNANPCYAELIRGIEDAAFARGYHLILCNADDDQHKQVAYLRGLMEKRIDGLVLVAVDAGDELALLLGEQRVPLVLVDRAVPGVAADFIETDQVTGGYLATRHLIELGHTDIGCVYGPFLRTPRLDGYRRALAEAGIAALPEFQVRSDFTSEGGFQAFRQLLALERRPTAIFACNDLMAIGGICAASEAGLRLPDDLSVIGHDDIAHAAYASPRLTTMAQPKYAMGERVAHMLVQRIVNDQLRGRQETRQATLVVRQSTAPPRN